MRVATAAALAVLVLAVQAPAVVPPGGVATLSFIDTDHAEIVYQGRDVTLQTATFQQTLAALAAVAGVPAGPWNPSLVETALSALGIPYLRARSCWPGDGSLVIYPTAPTGLSDEALARASEYYDPNHQPREFARSYWERMFRHVETVPAPPGWPGRPDMETLKEQIVDALPFPANLGTPQQYQARGFIPFLHVYGEYVRVCFLFVCFYWPKCTTKFNATAEGYGLKDVK